MKFEDVVPGQIVKVTASNHAGKAGRVKQTNPVRQTVALDIAGRIVWLGVEKMEPEHGKANTGAH